MTNEQAIAELQKERDLIQGERDLDGSQFAPALLEALAMAIEVLRCSEIPNCSEPKCADGCIYGWGSSECGHCDYRSEEPKTGDTISRKAAIDRLETIGYDFSDSGLSATELAEVCEAVGDVRQDMIRMIKRLPPAQPETHDKRTETHGVCLDVISRQAAMDANTRAVER